MSTKILIGTLRRGLLAVGVAALLTAAPAQAAQECNGFINISYPNSQIVNNIGDTLDVRIDLGAGTITGGPLNVLQVSSFGFDLSCADPPGPTPNCPSEGPVMSYDGDASIVTNCPGTIASNNPGGGPVPSHLVFTFTPFLSIPTGSPIPPGFCQFSFSETILAASSNANGVIEQVIGYDLARCDNGVLLSGGFQTGSVPVTPPDKYACYQVTKGMLKPKIPNVSVQDVFSTNSLTLTEMHRLCAPFVIPPDPALPGIVNGIHLAAYEFSSVGNSVVDTGVTAATLFGTFTFDVKGPHRLLVPTNKSLTPPGPASPPPLNAVRHFLCRDIDNITGPNLNNTPLTYADQFSPLLKPPGPITVPGFTKPGKWTICAPASKNNEDPSAVGNPSGLMCFFARPTPPFPTFKLFLNNQFGTNTQFGSTTPQATQLDEICVPATITP